MKTINENIKKVKGVVKGTNSRHGFLGLSNEPDIFVKPQLMDKVFVGDIVEATVTNEGKNNHVISIDKLLETKTKTLIGSFTEDSTGAYVLPDEVGYNRRVRIPKSFKNRARNNQYVKIEIIEHPFTSKKPKAKVIDIIGDKNSWHIQSDYYLSKYNIQNETPENVKNECRALVKKYNNKNVFSYKKRKDLTRLDFVTIDGENTIDIDDAIYVQKLEDKWKLLVAISDVSEFIKEGSVLDDNAYSRVSSVYLVGRTIPMLPNEFSSEFCSLKPLANRLVLVADMTINLDGTIDKYSFYEAIIRSKAKLSYNEVEDFVVNGKLNEDYALLAEPLNHLNELHGLLRESRKENNVMPPKRIDFRNSLDHSRKIECIEKMDSKVSHKMVEESMLLANKCAGDFISGFNIDAVFKYQNGVAENKKSMLLDYLNNHIELEGDDFDSYEGFKSIMSKIEEHYDSEKFKSVVNLFLVKSDFSKRTEPFYSMGFDSYTYFTSPIRRYSDIHTHRVIKARIKKKKYHSKRPDYIEHFRSKTNDIQLCCKNAEKWMQSEFIRDSGERIYSASIVDITPVGVSVILDNMGVEGLIPFSRINRERNSIDVHRMKLECERESYSILDKVNVSFVGIEVDEHLILFELESKSK